MLMDFQTLDRNDLAFLRNMRSNSSWTRTRCKELTQICYFLVS